MGIHDVKGPTDGHTPSVDEERKQLRHRKRPVSPFGVPEALCTCSCHGASPARSKVETDDYIHCDPCRVSLGDTLSSELEDDSIEGD